MEKVYVSPFRDHRLVDPYGAVPPDSAQVPVELVPAVPLSMMTSANEALAKNKAKILKKTKHMNIL